MVPTLFQPITSQDFKVPSENWTPCKDPPTFLQPLIGCHNCASQSEARNEGTNLKMVQICPIVSQTSKREEGKNPKGIQLKKYIGESSRSCFERGSEHQYDADNMNH